MDGGIGLIFVVMILVGVLYAAIHVVGFVVTTIGRVLTGVWRLLFGGARRDPWARAMPPEMDGTTLAGGERVCRNSFCEQFNLPAARFCARCGQRLV